MKTFFTSLIFIFGLLLMTYNQLLAQREAVVISDGMAVGAEIDEELKNRILQVVEDMVDKYYNVGSFWDSNSESFDDQKYTEFIGMFSGSARVYDDIADEPSNIEYSVYANNVFQYMQNEGVQFDLENIYINSIEADESGFYVADLDMEKIVYVGLDEDNFPVKFVEGRRYPLNMKIDMPDYDITDAKIQSILGQEKVIRAKTASMAGINFFYGLGSYITGDPNSIGNSFGEFTQKSTSSLGTQILYRKAINQTESFWFHLGVGAQYMSLTTGFNNFNNSGLAAEQRSTSPFIGALVNAVTPVPYTQENGSELLGSLIIESVQNGNESLNILTIDVPLGISFRALRTFSSRLFIDFSVVPSYSITSSGVAEGSPQGLFLPVSEHFPAVSDIQSSPNGEERLNNYIRGGDDFNFTDNDITAANNFGLGVQLSPTYQYDLDFNYGIEFGLNLWYNVLSLTASNDSSQGYLQSNYANNTFNTTTSILEDYYNGVSPFYAAVKVGFYYKLN